MINKPARRSALALTRQLVVLSILSWSAMAHAGAWTTGGFGHLVLQVGMNGYIADNQFDANGNQIPIQIFQYIEGSQFAAQVQSQYRSFEFGLYAELGLLKQLDLLVYFPFYKMISQTYPDNPDFQVAGLGDGMISAKANFLNLQRIVMSMRGGVELPLGDPSAGVNYPDPFQSKRLPMPLGDHEVAADLSLLASSSLFPLPIYLSAEFGARFHGSHKYGDSLVVYSNELLFSFEAGYQLFFKKYIWCWLPEIDFIVNFRGIASVGNGHVEGPPPTGYSYNLYLPYDQTYMQVGPMINVHLWKNFFVAARYERVFWGKNTGAGNIVGVAVGYNR